MLLTFLILIILQKIAGHAREIGEYIQGMTFDALQSTQSLCTLSEIIGIYAISKIWLTIKCANQPALPLTHNESAA
jgi:hypothetical protein